MMMFALTGFIAGLIHVLSGPDHLAALAPFTVDRPRRALFVGVHWALGHSCGVGLIALGSLLLREIIPVHLVSSYSERIVGILLIGIGLFIWIRDESSDLNTGAFVRGDENEVG